MKITGPIPDESTILKFWHLLESHALGTNLFEVINQHFAAQGLMLKEGTILDASIIAAAASSTKNQSGTRDPEMRQAKKGNARHFGMKMRIGVDNEQGLTHSLSTSAANVSDLTRAADLLHGDEQRVCGDSGYQGVDKRPEHQGREVEWSIAMEQLFGYAKARYRGLHKNTQRLALLLGFTNLLIGDAYELA